MELTRKIIAEEVEKRKEQIIKFGQDIIQKESITYSKNMPKIMSWIVNKGKNDGFEGAVINDENFPISAWSHFGNKDQWIGIMCHLDTVPYVESEWTYHPLSGTIADKKIWGRGVQDMKLSTVAIYVAMQIFKDLDLKLSKGIKIIYGSQEEVGKWEGMEHALDVLGTPNILLTAEGGWPAVQAESGIAMIDVKGKIPNHKGWSLKAGNMYNAVCSNAKLFINKQTHVFNGTAIHTMKTNFEKTDSAIPKAMAYLKKTYQNDKMIDFILKHWNNNRFGLGTPLAYETFNQGKSLINNSILNVKSDGSFHMGFDIRYPVHTEKGNLNWHLKTIKTLFEKFGFNNVSTSFNASKPAYFIDENNKALKTISQTYWNFTNTNNESQPLLKIHGGTYAKLKEHAIAFGSTRMQNDEIRSHMADENISLDSWFEAIKVFVEILYKLAK